MYSNADPGIGPVPAKAHTKKENHEDRPKRIADHVAAQDDVGVAAGQT